MIQICFAGAYDKLDFIMYISKILTATKRKVLVIDGTSNQRTRYIVPTIYPTISYVTEFEDIDFAVGFENNEKLESYLGDILNYDVVIYDIDTPEGIKGFNIQNNSKNYFVTSYDLYSIKKGIEILSALEENTKFNKIIFANGTRKEEEKYLEYLSLGCKVTWDKSIVFPILLDDYCVSIENQAVSKIKMKNLSSHYKECLMYTIMELLEDSGISNADLKKAMRIAEKDS